MFVFAYGSLLHPDSLRRTLPSVELDACVPTRCAGYRRSWTVAFPNDGSEQDKAYLRGDGSRPPVVLFCDLEQQSLPPAVTNGVCVPVTTADLDALRARELRYGLRDITSQVEPYRGDRPTTVVAFLGHPRFRDPADVARGVVSRGYLDTVTAGARFWDGVQPGFLADFMTGSRLPEASSIEDLARLDR